MRVPNLNALRMFDAAARHLSFRAAADALNLTQGAVAQQVRKLEADLGIRLFERMPRGLALTEAGRRYHATIADALALIESATASLRPAPRRVTLSVPPSLAAKWLVPRLAGFARAHPDIDLQTMASESLADFRRDGIDIAIRQGNPPNAPGCDQTRIAPLALLAVAAPGLAHGLPARPELIDFEALPLIEDGHAHWEALFSAEKRPPPNRRLRFNQTALAMDAAIQGQGIALAPALLSESAIQSGQLVAVWRPPDNGRKGFYLLVPNRGQRTARSAGDTRTVAKWLLSEAGASSASQIA